jgi:hypothetical protein
VLIKIRAPPGPTRMEVLQLVEIFRGRVADVSERSITLCVTGDAGKARPARTCLPALLAVRGGGPASALSLVLHIHRAQAARRRSQQCMLCPAPSQTSALLSFLERVS